MLPTHSYPRPGEGQTPSSFEYGGGSSMIYVDIHYGNCYGRGCITSATARGPSKFMDWVEWAGSDEVDTGGPEEEEGGGGRVDKGQDNLEMTRTNAVPTENSFILSHYLVVT